MVAEAARSGRSIRAFCRERGVTEGQCYGWRKRLNGKIQAATKRQALSTAKGSAFALVNVCGTPGCRCKDRRRPRKHGPYYQLSYAWHGRSTTRFVRAPRVGALRAKLANYKRWRDLVTAWVDVAIALEALERAATVHAD